MKNGLTELVFILDRSGSMSGLENDTIGGFNSVLEKQRGEEGECVVTTVLFDHYYELLHDRIDIRAVSPLTEKEYYVRGNTALLDAVGKTIEKIDTAQENTAEDYRAEHVIFVIITDGYENASREYTYPKIRALIKAREAKGWQFMFLGANIDVAETAERIGIRKEYSAEFIADKEGVNDTYSTLNDAIFCSRQDIDPTIVLYSLNSKTAMRKKKEPRNSED